VTLTLQLTRDLPSAIVPGYIALGDITSGPPIVLNMQQVQVPAPTPQPFCPFVINYYFPINIVNPNTVVGILSSNVQDLSLQFPVPDYEPGPRKQPYELYMGNVLSLHFQPIQRLL